MNYSEQKSGLVIATERTPCGKCFVCGFLAYTPQEMEHHVVKVCAPQNAEQYVADHSPRRGPQDPEMWDTEMEDYMKWGGKTKQTRAARKWDPWFEEHGIDPEEFDRSRRRQRPTC